MLIATTRAIDGLDSLPELARELYHTINQVNFRTLPAYTPAERRVYRFMASKAKYCSLRLPQSVVVNQKLQLEFKGESVEMKFDFVMEASEVISGSLLQLLKVFKEDVMLIFDALFTGKRVG